MAEQLRAPIVTILGHVDHGKTSLLDFIRKSAVAAKEHGGITQAIGAYQVTSNDKLITFIDTPGHAAFEKMRSRGAQVADIAVLVVAVDDGIMPQTVEAIKHIQAAKVPMVVALNKVDLPGINLTAQTEKIKRQLSDHGVLIEEYGGDVPIVPISAKTGDGVDKLLEIILLVAEMNEFKGDPSLPPTGVVIEAKIDKHKGPIATLIIRNGTLKVGEVVVVGDAKGKIRGLNDFSGKPVKQALPSEPIEILGLETVPSVGSILGEEKAKVDTAKVVQSLIEKLKADQSTILKVVIKADNQGSLEAIIDALSSLNQEEEHLKVVLSGTGDIMDSDISLASSVSGIVIGFNIKVVSSAQRIAETDHVLVRTYNVIYELIDEVKEVVDSLLEKGALEEVLGTAQILAEFPYGKNDRIAGSKVLDGTISKGPKARIVRDGATVAEVKIKSIKKVRDEVNRVEKGDECGMMFDTPADFRVGDLIESYRTL